MSDHLTYLENRRLGIERSVDLYDKSVRDEGEAALVVATVVVAIVALAIFFTTVGPREVAMIYVWLLVFLAPAASWAITQAVSIAEENARHAIYLREACREVYKLELAERRAITIRKMKENARVDG